MELILKKTSDGSHTIYNPEVNDHYHSTNGAIEESMHIYVKNGVLSHKSSSLSIFEVGLGTGLNALLTAIESTKRGLKVHYTSIEKYPLKLSLISKLNYCEILKGDSQDLYRKIIDAPWMNAVEINRSFILKKIKDDLCLFKPDRLYDIVYFDAFGPDKQPDIWRDEIILKTAGMINPNGIFITYSVTGRLKRLLKSSGFEVEHLPGPPGKRVITRAVKRSD